MSNLFRMKQDDDKKKPTRFYSNKQETHVAKAIKGRKVANSGATAFDKGDVTDDKWLIECKTCTKEQKSFTIQSEWIAKNREESIYMKKDHTAIAFNFGPDTKMQYIVDEPTFLLMKTLLDAYDRGEIDIEE